MKFFSAAIIMVFCTLILNAQTELIFDNMESYTAGEKLHQQATDSYWSTWSKTPGGSDDPYIVDSHALSGSKSLHIEKDKDIVMLFNDLTSGRYELEFHMFIPEGTPGYFNLLQEFAGTESSWAMECFMRENGIAAIHAGAQGAAFFNYEHEKWLKVRAVIDLTDDFASIFIDDQEKVHWIWSSGSSGASDLKQLAAINFYGWTNDSTNISCDFYIDDIKFSEVPAPEIPLNLTSTLDDNNISLSWDKPANSEPESYLIMSKYNIVDDNLTEREYSLQNLYPNKYSFKVKAFYEGIGFSRSSNQTNDTIQGFIDRDMVLVEINTGTWCTFCPGAAMGADDLVEHGHDAAVIEYHNGDDFSNDYSKTRELYYNIGSFPTTHVDGVIKRTGGSRDESLYPGYLEYYNRRMDYPSLYTIDLKVTHKGGDIYTAEISIEELYKYFSGGLRLRTALTESHIIKNWFSLTEVNFVCRKMIPEPQGVSLDFSASSNKTFTFNFSTENYVKDNCEFVVFIQHDNSKEVIQTEKVDLEDIPLGIRQNKNRNFSIYPNPAVDKLIISLEKELPKPAKIYLKDIYGNIVLEKTTANSNIKLNTSSLASGTYFLVVEQGQDIIYEKVMLTK